MGKGELETNLRELQIVIMQNQMPIHTHCRVCNSVYSSTVVQREIERGKYE
jgi:hypothetical protein